MENPEEKGKQMDSSPKRRSMFYRYAIVCACLGVGHVLLCLSRPLFMETREPRLFKAVTEFAHSGVEPYDEMRGFINYCKHEWDRAGLVGAVVTALNLGILFLVRRDARRAAQKNELVTEA
jgi:hypothetical protein